MCGVFRGVCGLGDVGIILLVCLGVCGVFGCVMCVIVFRCVKVLLLVYC